jgi:hypothetical protein
MPCRLINSRAERIAREHDDAALWLTEHDAERIAAEHEARRAAHRLPKPPGVVARRKEQKRRRRLAPSERWRMSASLIGRLGSSAIRPSTTQC